jgi:N6-L-threonylcarbamoyladenine synthase
VSVREQEAILVCVGTGSFAAGYKSCTAMRILAVESSCDESSVALLRDGRVLSMRTVTQSVHSHFGGVVPEIAGRTHLELISGFARQVLDESKMTVWGLDVIAATCGPGLVGSLLVGLNFGRGLALSLNKPFRAIHHVEAHMWSSEMTSGALPLPFLALIVSGGHSQLVLVEDLRRYTILGSTLDDALGEAYDKVGKLVGLQFPAGAAVDRLAANGDATRFSFPISMQDESLDFSFSGLKTAFLYALNREDGANQDRTNDMLAAFQSAALNSVMNKVERAALRVQPRALVAAGGVAANSRLRLMMTALADQLGIICRFPQSMHCGDNAAMIGYLAEKLESREIENPSFAVRPRWSLEELSLSEPN